MLQHHPQLMLHCGVLFSNNTNSMPQEECGAWGTTAMYHCSSRSSHCSANQHAMGAVFPRSQREKAVWNQHGKLPAHHYPIPPTSARYEYVQHAGEFPGEDDSSTPHYGKFLSRISSDRKIDLVVHRHKRRCEANWNRTEQLHSKWIGGHANQRWMQVGLQRTSLQQAVSEWVDGRGKRR